MHCEEQTEVNKSFLKFLFPFVAPVKKRRSSFMKPFQLITVWLFALVVAAGCASTEVTDRQPLVTERIPRPDHILVYDFVATPTDVPAESALAGQSTVQRTPQTAEQIATGRRVGAEIAARLLRRSAAWGCPQSALRLGRRRRSTTS